MLKLFYFSINITIIIVIVAVVLLIALIISLLIYKFSNKKYYLNKLDALLNKISISNKTQIESYLNRLNAIANRNDDYIEIESKYKERFDELDVDKRDALLLKHSELKEKIATTPKLNKELIDKIKAFENDVEMYSLECDALSKDLKQVFLEADELRIELTKYQNQYQEVLNDVAKYNQSLSICLDELNNYLNNIEMYFELLDDNIIAASYDLAKKNLQDIKGMLSNVYGNIELIAQYCNKVDVLIPQQLDDLLEKNDKLESEGYVVSHANVYEFIDNTNKLLNQCRSNFKLLSFGNFDEIFNEIQNKIAEVHAHLDNEVLAKNELDEKYKVVSVKIENAENDFIKTKRQFLRMVDYYKLPEEINLRFDNFIKNATYLADLKREYDGYVIVNAKIPASFMLEKVGKMDTISSEILSDIEYFTSYFQDIKTYAEKAFNRINDLTTSLIMLNGRLRKCKCFAVYNKYASSVNNTLNQLDEYKKLLLLKPIDLEKLLTDFSTIEAYSIDLVKNINIDFDNYETVKKCIIFTNPLRYQFADVDLSLREVEDLFIKGEYTLAQEKINYILNNYHPAAYDSFKGQ
ncbi:MAG: septation ring formation regulator EzrA [Candidatus Caccosoma sp.]|nr:septation ring formation regulator EzrA [Candidatus Caccosoma sp.]